MNTQIEHSMLLMTTYANGAEEWLCPICGCRFILQWPPAYKRIFLEIGDPNAAHNAIKGDMHINIGDLQLDPPEYKELDENSLMPWVEYIETLNVAKRLNDT